MSLWVSQSRTPSLKSYDIWKKNCPSLCLSPVHCRISDAFDDSTMHNSNATTETIILKITKKHTEAYAGLKMPNAKYKESMTQKSKTPSLFSD